MSQFNTASLADITADTSAIVGGATNNAAPVIAWLSDVETRIANLNDAMLAVASSQSGASLATNLQGQLFLDTDDTSLYLDPDGSGADDQVLTELSGYLADCATAGTDTFRIGGPLDVNTTDSARTTVGDFSQTYTLPANTLARNGQFVEILWSGTRSGAAGTFSLAPYFGSAAGTAVASTITSITDWIIKMRVTRTGVGTQDFAWRCFFNSDATGSTTLASVGTLTEDETAAITIKLNLSAISAGTVTQASIITKLGNS